MDPFDSTPDPAHVRPARLGLDVFSLRAQGWTPFEHLDFCASLGLSVLHFSEARFLGGTGREHLAAVRAHADARGIALEVGIRSICPSSSIFDTSGGTAEEQVSKAVDVALALGSPLVRCILGRFPDRTAPGGIEPRVAETVRVLKRVRTRVMDAGLRIAIENHAGDMQAHELASLVEAAGPEFTGVCLDSGNPLWAMEDPRVALEILAPYVLTSHLRDGVAWTTPEGAMVTWTRMGDGAVGMEAFIRDYLAWCPDRPLLLEVIIPDQPRLLNFRDPGFWQAYPRTPAWQFLRFLELAERGAPVETRPLAPGETPASRELDDVKACVEWTRRLLQSLQGPGPG